MICFCFGDPIHHFDIGTPCQSDSMRRERDVCEGICNRMILHFLYYCKYGVLFFGNDGAGPANESKRTKRVQGWCRQIMGGAFIICNTIALMKQRRHSCEHANKAPRLPF